MFDVKPDEVAGKKVIKWKQIDLFDVIEINLKEMKKKLKKSKIQQVDRNISKYKIHNRKAFEND